MFKIGILRSIFHFCFVGKYALRIFSTASYFLQVSFFFFRVFQARIVKYEANAKRTQSTSRVRDLFLLPIILRINQPKKKKNCPVLRGDYIQTFKLSAITCIHLFRVTFPFNSGAEVRRGAASTSGGRGDRRW